MTAADIRMTWRPGGRFSLSPNSDNTMRLCVAEAKKTRNNVIIS